MKLDDCVSFQLARTSRALYRPYKQRLRRYELTPPQLFLLLALYECDGVAAGELAARVYLDKSTLTGMLIRLEKLGLIKRDGDENDGRTVRVVLTDKARRLRRPLVTIHEEVNARVLHSLGGQATLLPQLLCALERATVE